VNISINEHLLIREIQDIIMDFTSHMVLLSLRCVGYKIHREKIILNGSGNAQCSTNIWDINSTPWIFRFHTLD